jgi:hypothetical protein
VRWHIGTGSLERLARGDDNSCRLGLGLSHNWRGYCDSMCGPHEVIPVRPPHHIKENDLNDDDRNPKETLVTHRQFSSVKDQPTIQKQNHEEDSTYPSA